MSASSGPMLDQTIQPNIPGLIQQQTSAHITVQGNLLLTMLQYFALLIAH
jgi:hypothetical protein